MRAVVSYWARGVLRCAPCSVGGVENFGDPAGQCSRCLPLSDAHAFFTYCTMAGGAPRQVKRHGRASCLDRGNRLPAREHASLFELEVAFIGVAGGRPQG